MADAKKVLVKESSRTNWLTPAKNEHGYPGDDQIKIGCLMRIADATEVMAKNNTQLLADIEFYKRNRDFYQERSKKLANEKKALKGVVTKQRKRIEELEVAIQILKEASLL